MKKILFLSVGVVTFFLQTASAQLLSFDGWQAGGGGMVPPHSVTMTNSTYSLALTFSYAPDGGIVLVSPHTMNITEMLANSTSIWFDVYAPAGSFGGNLGISLEILNPDTGYVSLDNYSFPEMPAFGVQTNMCFPIPAALSAVLAASPNPTGFYFQMLGGFTLGNETLYMENFCFNYRYTGTNPVANPPTTTPGNTFYARSVSGVTLGEFATGFPPLYYQWQTDGAGGGSLTNIPDATNATYVFNTDDVGTYQFDCVVSNSYGAVTSTIAPVHVLPASVPVLTSDMNKSGTLIITNVYSFIGGSASFAATFGLGTQPITNQWMANTGGGYAPIAGANANTLAVTNVQASSAGWYELAATNLIGGSNSTPAHLTALTDPAAPPSNGVTNMYSYCVMTDHPWAYWKFEETNDTITSSMQAYDYSGHNFDATYGNGDGTTGSGCKDGGESANAGQYGPGNGDSYHGFPVNNKCAMTVFGHNNGNLTVPPLNLNTNTVTFTMWIFPNSDVIVPGVGLLMNRNGTDAAGIGFGSNVQTNDEGRSMAELGYTWNNNSSATYNWHSGLYPIGGVWSFVACVITPANTTMYLCCVDGDAYGLHTNLFKAVSSTTNAPEAFSGGTTWIGGDNWAVFRNFDGTIDEVAVFTNALSESSILNLFLSGLGMTTGISPIPPPPPGPWQPTNTTIFQGQTFHMSFTASGIPLPWYQWQYENGTSWGSLGTATGRTPNDSTLIYPNYTSLTVTNFRCIATNVYGGTTSSVAVLTVIPVPNWNKGLWTVNFAIVPSPPVRGQLYVGRGVLGTNTYWNALGGSQFTNTPPSLLDDGATISGINRGVNFGSTNSRAALPSLSDGGNNALLDNFCDFGASGAAFVFTSVPNGTYNLALYGIDGAYAGCGTIFTVNGVSQSVTNAQDADFLPDNTVIYTNLLLTNGKLEVDMMPVPSTPSHPQNIEGDFNGAQLELITWGPNILSLTNRGTNLILTYVGGLLLESTNVLGPWKTNNPLYGGAVTINPTGAMKFYRVFANKNFF